jgi:pimeloyl-ACP methyl ester carboxylesterase
MALHPEVHYARDGDLNLAYTVLGDGPFDVVWVPIWISNIDLLFEEPSYARFFERIASYSRLIVFDRRGTGLSDAVAGAPTLEERMEDITIVMDAVGSRRAALLGFSEGGPMAALYAATHPSRVSALALYGAYAKGRKTHGYPFAPAGSDERWNVAMRQWGTGENLKVFAPSAADDPRFRAWYARLERNSASPATTIEILRLNFQIDIRDVLPAIDVPTLVLHRADDTVVDAANGRYLAARIPEASYVELRGFDHIPIIGDVDAILDELEEFLTGMRPRGEPDRVLATVLFTDIVGSTERAAELGDRGWAYLLAGHHAAVRRELERHRGVEIKTVGDGSWPPSTVRRGRSGRRRRSSRRWESSGSTCAPGCTPGRWMSPRPGT